MIKENYPKLSYEIALSLLFNLKIHRKKEKGGCYSPNNHLLVDEQIIRQVALRGFPNRICKKCVGKELREEINELIEGAIFEIRLILDFKPNLLDYTLTLKYGEYKKIRKYEFNTFRLNPIYVTIFENWIPLYVAGKVDPDNERVVLPLDFRGGIK